ncbi:MAG: IS110 family transposase [Acidobacteriota bacterium]
MSSAQSLQQVLVPGEFEIFAGLDVDKTRIAITFTDHDRLLKSLQMPYSSQQLLNYTRKHFADRRVVFVYEAGPTGFQLHDDLTRAGHCCLVVAPSMVPRAPGQRVKTNRIDSRKLSEGLRGGQLKSIHVPSLTYRQLRHLVQLRDSHVRQMSAAKCRIKALLLYESIALPEAPASSQWSARVLRELGTLPCSAAVRFKLDSLIASLYFHQLQAAATQKQMRRFCQQDPELSRSIRYLTTIPGIGWIVASHLVARLGDWRQIRNVRQIAGLLGLVSSEHSTGERVHRGSITRAGDVRLRNKLVETAWTTIRLDPELREFYQRIYQRHPRPIAARKAIVAVARKLTTRIYSVLKQQRPFRPQPEAAPAPLTQRRQPAPGDAST